MKEKLKKYERSVTWAGAIIAACALGTGAFQYLEIRAQNATDNNIKTVFVAEFAAYKEWKKAATKDLEIMEADHKKMMGEIAALKATVEFLSKGKRQMVKPFDVSRSPSMLKTGKKIEVGHEQIQQQMQKLFPEMEAH